MCSVTVDAQPSHLKAQIQRLDALSTAPAILMPLLDMMRLSSEEIRIEKVIELVSYDTAIAAQCLRIANSPLFGTRYIETVHSAVLALGLEKVRSILLGLCVHSMVPEDKWVIAPDAFWRHALGCALVTQQLAEGIHYPQPEKAYLAGLLHDLGFLVNSMLYTDQFRACLRRASEEHIAIHIVENQILGFTHSESGQMLCEHWGLPPEFAKAAGSHHDANLLLSSGALAVLVHLSDLLCRSRRLGYGYDEVPGAGIRGGMPWHILLQTYPATEKLGIDDLTRGLDAALDNIAATVESVFGPAKPAPPEIRKQE